MDSAGGGTEAGAVVGRVPRKDLSPGGRLARVTGDAGVNAGGGDGDGYGGWEDVLGGGSLVRRRQKWKQAEEDTDNGDGTGTAEVVEVDAEPARPQDGQEVIVHLVGRVLETDVVGGGGLPAARPLPPPAFASCPQLTFRVGEDEVPTGLDLGVRLMHVGESLTLRMVARLAFGDHGAPADLSAPGIPISTAVMPGQDIEFSVTMLGLGAPRQPVERMTLAARVVSAERKVALGNLAFRRGNVRRAAGLFARAIKFVQPDGPAVLSGSEAGGGGDDNDNDDDGASELAEARAVFACYARAGSNLAVAWGKIGYADREICKLCRSVLSVAPEARKAQFQLGRALVRMLEYDDAKACFRSVLATDPGNKAAKKELNRLSAAVAKYRKRERAMFKGGVAALAGGATSVSETAAGDARYAGGERHGSGGLRRRVDIDMDGDDAGGGGSSRNGSARALPKSDERAPSLLEKEDNDENDVQPVSEVCRRGTCVAKSVGMLLVVVLGSITAQDYFAGSSS